MPLGCLAFNSMLKPPNRQSIVAIIVIHSFPKTATGNEPC